MIGFSCWGCGKTLKARDNAAGMKCKCSCGRENTIPEFESSGEVTEPSVLKKIPEPPSFPELGPEPEPEVVRTALPAVRHIEHKHFIEYKVNEPWYFKAIEYWCYFNLALGFLGMMLVLFLFSKDAVERYRLIDNLGAALRVTFLVYIWGVLALFGYVASWAVILVGLDVARNIRGIRHAAFRIADKD